MQNRYKVTFTPTAKEELTQIHDYLMTNLNAPIAALNLVEEIEQKTTNLELNPYIYTLVDDKYLSYKGIRRIVIKKFIALYIINEQEKIVNIIHVKYGASDYIQNLARKMLTELEE
jgi:addiction module RelE/StbE family toxin